ncbi:hypothetical protein VNI00_014819 [Paramarasmius palmivorus]|uniref:CxC5 like cysteine cluster associated with KDZ domain-containing protein n=1 Tax=Paramarasmius palmivorus TaxID=297713 RepID=A0AAW0BQH1_9AGAR
MERISVAQLTQIRNLPAEMTLSRLASFIRIIRRLKDELIHTLHLPDPAIPPNNLPSHIVSFLSVALSLTSELVASIWDALRDWVWNAAAEELTFQERELFEEYGRQSQDSQKHLAAHMFYPPVQTCLRCPGGRTLNKISRIPVTYFTVNGPECAFSTSFRCPNCHARYHPQYYVAERRYYYGFQATCLPDFVHFEQHAFMSSELCELFTALMVFAWVSSQNCATIYNNAMSKPVTEHRVSSLSLSSEQVWRAFVLNALLRDCKETDRTLEMPDGPGLTHDDRLKYAQTVRNDRIALHGQAQRLHACETCEKFVDCDDPGGHKGLAALRAIVMDGITIGHPCCKVHNCTEPLPNNRAHFCESHQHLKTLCVVKDCTRSARSGGKTCDLPAHVKLDEYKNLKGKGFFLLKQCLQQIGQQPKDSFGTDTNAIIPDDGEIVMDDPSHKSDHGNVQLTAQYGRRRTHNEQLGVACCGIIVFRVTMNGAESVSGVKDIAKSVYEPEELPQCMFFDNNCQLQEHLIAQKDDYFRYVYLPVDVFHFKSKHKQTDTFCQKHCNPARFKKLVGEDGKWVFNSSVAEQTNVWMGGYQAIVRDMLAHNYSFFLDEMIKRRNEYLVAKLQQTQKFPYLVPSAAELRQASQL